jgi:hypothetical protein
VSSVRLFPEGLRFARPASLTLSYAHCEKLLPLPVTIVYTTDDLRILELLQSRDDPLRKRVQSPLDHFSRYAASWHRGGRNRSGEDGSGPAEDAR